MITCISTSSVAVLEAHQIIELGRRGFEHVAVHNRLDLVDQLGGDMHTLTGSERTGDSAVTLSGAELELAPQYVHGLVLEVVVLKAEHVSRLHVKNLPHVSIGASPDQLVAPGLLHPVGSLRHSQPPQTRVLTWAGIYAGQLSAGQRGSGGKMSERLLEAEYPAESKIIIDRPSILRQLGARDEEREIESG